MRDECLLLQEMYATPHGISLECHDFHDPYLVTGNVEKIWNSIRKIPLSGHTALSILMTGHGVDVVIRTLVKQIV